MIVEAFEIAQPESGKESLKPLTDLMERSEESSLKELFTGLSRMCAENRKPIVLMIDEIDSASNNQVFIDFLAQLRVYYLKREIKAIFHSVILAGVYDIKNLKLKLRPDTEHKYNSPWNIAAKFTVDMNFSVDEIASMLQEYEADRQIKMDIVQIAEHIYAYTSGYPYLVSAICKLLDEGTGLSDEWSENGIARAVNSLLLEQAPFFESMVRQLEEYPEMKQMLKAILFLGKRISYNPDIPSVNMATMFGYVTNSEGSVHIANRIFEMRLYNLFLSEEELSNAIYGEKNEKFLEEHGRKFFLLYLKPIINGTGNYYVEAQTRDARRTDVIVDYCGEQFIIELKIWRGNEYNERGERQLADYLDFYHKDKGYMISFNFSRRKIP